MTSDVVARDFVLLAARLRSAARGCDVVVKHLRAGRRNQVVRSPVRGADATGPDFQSITDEAVRPWIDGRYACREVQETEAAEETES